jgi:hypothetical protein
MIAATVAALSALDEAAILAAVVGIYLALCAVGALITWFTGYR